MTDTEAVLRQLRLNGPHGLTALESLRDLGVMRLAARINDLRALGHQIRTETVVTANKKRIGRYVLVEEPQQLAWTAA